MTESKHYKLALDAVANMTKEDEAKRFSLKCLPWQTTHDTDVGTSEIMVPIGSSYHQAVIVRTVGTLSHVTLADTIVGAVNSKHELQDALKEAVIIFRTCEDLGKEPLDWGILEDIGIALNHIEELLTRTGANLEPRLVTSDIEQVN